MLHVTARIEVDLEQRSWPSWGWLHFGFVSTLILGIIVLLSAIFASYSSVTTAEIIISLSQSSSSMSQDA